MTKSVVSWRKNENIFFCRGAAYADSLRYQRCIDLWLLTLHVRVARHSIVFTDTCFTAQALVRLMLDLQEGFIDVQRHEFNHQGVPRFEDVYDAFMLLTENILGKVHTLRMCDFEFINF